MRGLQEQLPGDLHPGQVHRPHRGVHHPPQQGRRARPHGQDKGDHRAQQGRLQQRGHHLPHGRAGALPRQRRGPRQRGRAGGDPAVPGAGRLHVHGDEERVLQPVLLLLRGLRPDTRPVLLRDVRERVPQGAQAVESQVRRILLRLL